MYMCLDMERVCLPYFEIFSFSISTCLHHTKNDFLLSPMMEMTFLCQDIMNESFLIILENLRIWKMWYKMRSKCGFFSNNEKDSRLKMRVAENVQDCERKNLLIFLLAKKVRERNKFLECGKNDQKRTLKCLIVNIWRKIPSQAFKHFSLYKICTSNFSFNLSIFKLKF